MTDVKVETGLNVNNITEKKPIIEDEDDDTASVLVIILQCETRPCDDNINNLKWVFSDPYFTVQVCAVDPPPKIVTNQNLTSEQYIENYYMRKALTYAGDGPYITNQNNDIQPQRWWHKLPCIIVKDSSVSHVVPAARTNQSHPDADLNKIGGMKKRIKTALQKAKKADLFFLCKWNDSCNLYTDIHDSPLKWSKQPTATQAIMYTPSARDYIKSSINKAKIPLSEYLNVNIAQGKLLATVFVPNIIDFDINLATSNQDYAKLNECAPIAPPPESTTVNPGVYWLVVIMVVCFIIMWLMMQVRA